MQPIRIPQTSRFNGFGSPHPTSYELENAVWCLADSMKHDHRDYICSACEEDVTNSQRAMLQQLCDHIERERHAEPPSEYSF